jgi:hypothetical protein
MVFYKRDTQSVLRYSNKYSSMPDKYDFSILKYHFSMSQPTLRPFSFVKYHVSIFEYLFCSFYFWT